MIAFLIRHAQVEAQDTIGRRPAIPLSPEGEAQARLLAERLQSREIAAIFSSPLARTLRTAQILAESRGIPVETDACLNEIDFGEWDNRAIDSLKPLDSWKSFNTFRSGARCPGGEMMIEVQSRVVGLLERLTTNYPGGNVAVVSHADVIRAAVCHYLGVPLDLSLRIQISPASLTILRLENSGAELLRLNDAGD
jgi:broad specificity phosphatase PhoE